MANDRGLLPKASREDLSEHLTRQLDRWYQNAYQDDNLFSDHGAPAGAPRRHLGLHPLHLWRGLDHRARSSSSSSASSWPWNNQCVH